MVSKKQRDSLTWLNENTPNITSRLLCWELILKLHNCVFDVDQKLNDSQRACSMKALPKRRLRRVTWPSLARSRTTGRNTRSGRSRPVQKATRNKRGVVADTVHEVHMDVRQGSKRQTNRARNFVRRAQKHFGGLCCTVPNTGRPPMKINSSSTTRTAHPLPAL